MNSLTYISLSVVSIVIIGTLWIATVRLINTLDYATNFDVGVILMASFIATIAVTLLMILIYKENMSITDTHGSDYENLDKLNDIVGSKVYIRIKDEICLLDVGNHIYTLKVVKNNLDDSTHNLIHNEHIVGAITKKDRITGKLHLGAVTGSEIGTCVLTQLSHFPEILLLKPQSGGRRYSIDTRQFITVNQL